MKKKYFIILCLIFIGAAIILPIKKVDIKPKPQSMASPPLAPANKPIFRSNLRSLPSKTIQASTNKSSNNRKVKKTNDLGLGRLYCKIKDLAPNITLDGEIKIFAGGYNPYDPGVYAWIYSSKCPKDKYSIVKINNSKNIEMALDCHNTTIEDLVAESGLQWNVTRQDIKAGEFNFALNGKGQFLIYCPNERSFFLTRVGRFLLDNEGYLRNHLNCILQKSGTSSKPQHKPLVIPSFENQFDDRGCVDETNECIAVVQYNDPSVLDFEYINPNVSRVEMDDVHLNSGPFRVFSDYLENLNDADRGPTGIQKWNKVESLNMPIECPN